MKIPELHPIPDKIFIGFSGGADSTALLLLLHEKYINRLVAIHFNHGIRSESFKEEVWCRKFCVERNINFQSFQFELPPNSTENESRNARLRLWKQLVLESDGVVALAHHQDDINENFFLRLMRGSGVSGLTGLRIDSRVDGIHFWRPLLNFHKQDLLMFLQEQGVESWCEDESNVQDIYRRNRVRHELIPLYQVVAQQLNGLESSIQVLRQEAEFIEQLAWQEFATLQKDGTLKRWQKVPKVLIARVLRLLVRESCTVDFIPSPATVERVYQAIHSHATAEILIPLSSRFQVSVQHCLRLIDQNHSSATVPKEVQWHPLKEAELQFGAYTFSLSDKGEEFDLDRLQLPLKITTFKPGDRMQVDSGLTKKLKKIFNEKKLEHVVRRSIPVVWSDDHIIWIPSLARSKSSLPQEKSKNTVMLFVEQNFV